MDLSDRDRIVERYNRRLAQFGDDIRSLASGTEERRRVRFQTLCEIGRLEGKRLLDLGCGFGDLLTYLRELDVEVDYTGYDINPQLIDVARGKFPGARFEVKDIQSEDFPEFDYIVSTSCFN